MNFVKVKLVRFWNNVWMVHIVPNMFHTLIAKSMDYLALLFNSLASKRSLELQGTLIITIGRRTNVRDWRTHLVYSNKNEWKKCLNLGTPPYIVPMRLYVMWIQIFSFLHNLHLNRHFWGWIFIYSPYYTLTQTSQHIF